jgi:hypothetical protein
LRRQLFWSDSIHSPDIRQPFSPDSIHSTDIRQPFSPDSIHSTLDTFAGICQNETRIRHIRTSNSPFWRIWGEWPLLKKSQRNQNEIQLKILSLFQFSVSKMFSNFPQRDKKILYRKLSSDGCILKIRL